MSDRLAKIIAAGEADAELFRQQERAAVVAWMRERAANMRRYPFESRAKADAMVIAAREFQDAADLLERLAHHLPAQPPGQGTTADG